MTAVSNSSPLIFYARIGRLDILEALFDEILVPPAVWQEVVTVGRDRHGSSEVAGAPWIRERLTGSATHWQQLESLDPGEREAIALVLDLETAVPVLLDDRRARRIALGLGLIIIGSAGIVVRAKDVGLVASIRPLLADLQAAGLYLSEGATGRLLESAGEL
jgi:uncharacterized protein